MPRATVHYAGRVQGVGFRATTRSVARDFVVAGFVENLPDGRVLLVVEGETDELDAFLAAVRDRLGRFIQHAQRDTAAATGEFGRPAPGGLTIRY